MRAVPATRPSAGVRSISSCSSRRPRWAATAKRPYSTKLPRSTRSATFSRAVRPPAAWRRATASGRASSSVSARRASSSARSSRSGSPSGIRRPTYTTSGRLLSLFARLRGGGGFERRDPDDHRGRLLARVRHPPLALFVDRLDLVQRLAQDAGDLEPPPRVERPRDPGERGQVVLVEGPVLERRGEPVDEGLDRRFAEGARERERHLAPFGMADVGARRRPEEVLDRPPPPRRAHLPHAAGPLQHPRVVGEVAERQ